MKFSKIIMGQAIGAAMLLSSASAFAYVPTSNTDADVVIYWGGATASTLSAQELTTAAICATDTHLLYVTPNSGTNPKRAGNDWAIACRTSTAKTGLTDGTRVLVIKRDRGGSGVGVGPVQTKSTDPVPTGGAPGDGGKISFQNISPAVCNIAATGGVDGAPAIQDPAGAPGTLIPVIGCSVASTVFAYTEMGTADIEANKFFDINTPIVDGAGIPFRTESDRGFAEENSLAALTFNTPVTLALFTRLQEAQFDVSSVCHPSNAGYSTLTTSTTDRPDTTNGESEACMPSLTRSEIDSILTGRIVGWNQLLRADGTAIPSLTGAVQICRRVDGSGTQATINALVSSFPCDPNLADGSVDIVKPRGTASAQLVLNSGSSDVDNCLHNFNATANPYAIGVLSVEGRNTDRARNWRFIKVDGVAPTLRNIHAGDYWLWAQQACMRRGETLPYNAAVGALDTIVNKDRIFDALCGSNATNGLNSLATLTKLNNPTNLANCNAGTLSACQSFYTWGQSGWLATATAANIYDVVLAASTRPINAYSREFSAGRVNICQTPLKSNASGSAAKGTIVAPNPNWTP
jgi:ABC-type phosphate transport system substrate-binding protein